MPFFPLLHIILVVFLAVFTQAASACAEITMQAPEKAGTGSAFAATAFSSEPLDKILFSWRGKKIAAKAMPENGRWVASVLLPVPLGEKAGVLPLAASEANGKTTRKNIKIENVKRPEQKLTVDKKFVNPPKAAQEQIKADRAKVQAVLARQSAGRQWELPFDRPVPGGVSSQFGLKRVFNGEPRGEHRGLDLRGAQGTPVHAAADGVVALVDNLYYSGNTVYIDHGEGVFSAYLHLSKTNVHPGQTIKRGQILGEVGATGRVTGPHLHLSVIAQGQSVDPLPLLKNNVRKKSGAHANGQ